MEFDSLVLSGGGTKCIAQLGVLDYYYNKGRFDPTKIIEYVGSSGGSINCLLLNCGYTHMEIFSNICTTSEFLKPTHLNFLEIMVNYGLYNIETILKIVVDMIKNRKCNKTSHKTIPTFSQLYHETDTKLTIVVTNETFGKSEYCNVDTTPNMSVLTALSMSCCIPFLFKRILYEGNHYIDGGILDNFPMSCISCDRKSTLGIFITGKVVDDGKGNILNYLYRLSCMPIHKISSLNYSFHSEKNNIEIVPLRLDNLGSFDFNMSQECKIQLLACGFKFAEFYDSRKSMSISLSTLVSDTLEELNRDELDKDEWTDDWTE